MASPVTQRVLAPYQLSSTGGVAKGSNSNPSNGVLGNILCSSASNTPTITVYDSSDTSKVLVPTFTPTAGVLYNFDLMFQTALNIVLSGTITGVAGYI